MARFSCRVSLALVIGGALSTASLGHEDGAGDAKAPAKSSALQLELSASGKLTIASGADRLEGDLRLVLGSDKIPLRQARAKTKVLLKADPKTPFALVTTTMNALAGAGFRNVSLQVDRRRAEMNIPPRGDLAPAAAEPLPPVRIRLVAGPKGQLGAIRINDRGYAKWDDAQQALGQLARRFARPDSLERAEFEILADPNLPVEMVMIVHSAVQQLQVKSEGKSRALAAQVHLFPRLTQREIVIEQMEESDKIEVVDPKSPLDLEVEIAPNAPPFDKPAPKIDLEVGPPAAGKSGLGGVRSAKKRAALLARDAESSQAIAAALKWLAEHQLPDGGWSWDHRAGRCGGKCSGHGALKSEARAAATGLALLAFLNAGNTHLEGKYKTNVKAGLTFLLGKAKVKGQLADWTEPGGRMYSHGIAAIAVCEAYAMTADKQLQKPAQMAINFIAHAQDPVGGGWRYTPRQAGDTSVFGWQIQALMNGRLASLKVPQPTIAGAKKFLDAVQSDSGAKYGYTAPGAGQATTAIGLLGRFYLGAKAAERPIKRGLEFISGVGPSKSNMYYNFYATKLLALTGDKAWEKWRKELHAYLLREQAKTGHEAGSWRFRGGDHGADRGGRLYFTALATLILETRADPMQRIERLVDPDKMGEKFPL